jgi:hypothetical protein
MRQRTTKIGYRAIFIKHMTNKYLCRAFSKWRTTNKNLCCEPLSKGTTKSHIRIPCTLTPTLPHPPASPSPCASFSSRMCLSLTPAPAHLYLTLPRQSHPILQGKPNASHMCARIRFTHT